MCMMCLKWGIFYEKVDQPMGKYIYDLTFQLGAVIMK